LGSEGAQFGESLWQFTGERLNIFNVQDFITPGYYKEKYDGSKSIWFSREFNAKWLETKANGRQIDISSLTLSATVGTPPVTPK
jgi:hypothetical protein